MEEIQLPFLQAIRRQQKTGRIPLHMPGHKQGRSIIPPLQSILGPAALYDYTELPFTDDLSQPVGALKESQAMLAHLYGADASFYLVNGTSGGIMATIFALSAAGKKVLLMRNSHRSVSQGLILSGATPVYMATTWDKLTGVALPPTVDDIRSALEQHADIALVILTAPSFHGLSGHLEEQIKLVHSFDLPVMVDEAHGVHTHFSNLLPKDALQSGADAVIQSTHKTLSGFTQCSWMHIQGTRVSPARIQAALRILQTTSPSYILLLSLEGAMAQMAMDGPEKLTRSLELTAIMKERLNHDTPLKFLELDELPLQHVAGQDIGKLYLRTAPFGLSGFQAANLLRLHGLEPELADSGGVLLMLTLADEEEHFDAIEASLRAFAKTLDTTAEPFPLLTEAPWAALQPNIALTPREAWFAEKELVDFNQSVGRISGETVTVYPPGVPVLLPGEIIEVEILEYLMQVRKFGGNIVCDNHSLQTLTVIKQ